MENINTPFIKCSRCGHQLSKTAIFCKYCGKKVDVCTETHSFTGANQKERDRQTNEYASSEKKESSQSVFDRLNDYVGNTGSRELNWRNLFSDVFKQHTMDEAEEIFICGTKQTTPSLSNISSTWPNPWLYSRVFLIFAIVFILLKVCWECFANINVIPGLIMVGAFTVPLTTIILFLEVNAFRNISLYQVVRNFLVGGCASMFVALILFSIFLQPDEQNLTFINACIIGVVEELAKAIVIFFILKHSTQCKYILSALLIGASVGAGFAAFESAGYAFVVLLNNLDGNAVGAMLDNIYLRGFMAPGAHVTWAAISAVAIMLARGDRPLEFDVFFTGKFYSLYLLCFMLYGTHR